MAMQPELRTKTRHKRANRIRRQTCVPRRGFSAPRVCQSLPRVEDPTLLVGLHDLPRELVEVARGHRASTRVHRFERRRAAVPREIEAMRPFVANAVLLVL